MKQCPNCYKEIQDDAVFCQYCGQNTSSQADQIVHEMDQPTINKSKNKRTLLIIGAAMFFLIAVGVLVSRVFDSTGNVPFVSTSCANITADYRAQIESLADRWDNANKLANSTPRIQLAIPISQLQDIRSQVADLDVPNCAMISHTALLDYMDASIDGYLGFMSEESDADVNRHFDQASQYFDSWSAGFAQLAEK